MNPKVIMGNKHESFLLYLDKKIVETGQKNKTLALFGLGLIGAHFLFYKMTSFSQKN